MEPTPTTPQAQLKILEADIRRLGQMARKIAPGEGYLSAQLHGGIGARRRDLFADATLTLARLAQLRENPAPGPHPLGRPPDPEWRWGSLVRKERRKGKSIKSEP